MNDRAIGCGLSATDPTPENDVRRRAILKSVLLLPVIAAFIVLLFLTMGHARISQTGSRFIGALIYSLFIGTPSAILLTWISFNWTRRLGRLVVLPQALVLVLTATLGSLAAAVVCQWVGFVSRGEWWHEFRTSYPFSVVITLVVGMSMTTYQTVRQQLHSAVLELRSRQVEQERAYKLLAEARLSSLESRLHPHFLFNTLNSIAALIPRDPQRAEDTVGKLASLLRFSLASSSVGLVPLAQELKFVRDYLEIESTRFGPRLQYEIDIPETLMEVKTPPMALQSLVENAVKHVASQRPQGARVHITGRLENGLARLEVSDDGPGFSLDAIKPEHGLGNLIARVQLLFGDRGKLLVTRGDALTVVGLEFPAEG
jgi:two-component system, LytTR family, sensor histidine kinase AlgZ